MNIFSLLYNEALYRPLVNLLVGITAFIPGHNIGIAIVLVTLLVRLVLLPSSLHQARMAQRNQKKMATIQAQLKKLKEEHKDDKTKLNAATMALYKEAGINPASGCLPLLIQFPVLIALYRVFLNGIGPATTTSLYSFVHLPASVSFMFLGIPLDKPTINLAVVAGIGQFWQTKNMTALTGQPTPMGDDNSAKMMASMQKNMMYMFPVMTAFIALRLPAALPLYWVTTTLFGIAQQYLLRRSLALSPGTPIL
jgi:YidC/Oxa1 family membrane protein insertase